MQKGKLTQKIGHAKKENLHIAIHNVHVRILGNLDKHQGLVWVKCKSNFL